MDWGFLSETHVSTITWKLAMEPNRCLSENLMKSRVCTQLKLKSWFMSTLQSLFLVPSLLNWVISRSIVTLMIDWDCFRSLHITSQEIQTYRFDGLSQDSGICPMSPNSPTLSKYNIEERLAALPSPKHISNDNDLHVSKNR